MQVGPSGSVSQRRLLNELVCLGLNDSVAIPTLTSPEVWVCGLVGDYACALTDPDVLSTSDNVLVDLFHFAHCCSKLSPPSCLIARRLLRIPRTGLSCIRVRLGTSCHRRWFARGHSPGLSPISQDYPERADICLPNSRPRFSGVLSNDFSSRVRKGKFDHELITFQETVQTLYVLSLVPHDRGRRGRPHGLPSKLIGCRTGGQFVLL